VALNNEGSFEGGALLALNGSGLKAPSRGMGTALLHAGNLVHGVTKIERGTRYSLILFFHRKTEVPQPARAQPLPGAAVDAVT
jgi:hypothetical protein